MVLLSTVCLFALGLSIRVAYGTDVLRYPVWFLKLAPVLDGKVEGDAAWQRIPRATGFHVLGGARKVPKQSSLKYVDIGGDYRKQGIHLMAKSCEGKLHLIAVNPNEELPVAPEFMLPAGSYSKVDVLFEDRSLKPSGNTFRDIFEPLDVHVCRIESNGGSRAGESGIVRFGMSADSHVRSPGTCENNIRNFVEEMGRWKADFIIDLGDFAVQVAEGTTTPELHDGQLENLKRMWELYNSGSYPAYVVMGNHDVGWINGGDEVVTPEDLCTVNHTGEDITKQEFLTVTGLPHRYYSFDVKGCHFIVLDGNNESTVMQDVPRGHDGLQGGYCIDRVQLAWLAKDLAANRDKPKVIFCHEELHHTPLEGSGEGGDVPFPPSGKEHSYVDNGWQVRDMLTADGKVLACFFGHKHHNRWVVYGGVNYITLAATHVDGSYAKVTISDKLHIRGFMNQRNYALPVTCSP